MEIPDEPPLGQGSSGLDESASDGVADETGDLVDAELDHEVAPVGLRCLLGDSQNLGNLLRRLALGDELQDLPLSDGEKVLWKPCLPAIGPDDHVGDRRAHIELPAADVPNRLHEV